jgi:hypothetical protein
MTYAALIRPVIDRVYVSLRAASRDRVRAVYERFGVRPGFETSFYFGLLARPMPAAGFAAATTYSGSDMTDELAMGTAAVDADGTWRLTELGRDLALAVQQAIAEGAAEFWDERPIATLPGLASVPRLADLVDRLLTGGLATGGPAYHCMVPVYEPTDASPALRLTTRLGALRHHRADAHRAAWAAAGLTIGEVRSLPDGPARQAIEDDTNRRDAPIYASLSDAERLELLAGLGALPG